MIFLEPQNGGFSLFLTGLFITLISCALLLPLPKPDGYLHPTHPVVGRGSSVSHLATEGEDVLTHLLKDLREWRPPSLLG